METEKTERKNVHNSTPPALLYEPIPNDAVTADEWIERWLWLGNPVYPPPKIIMFKPQNRVMAVQAIEDLRNRMGVVLTDGWTGENET